MPNVDAPRYFVSIRLPGASEWIQVDTTEEETRILTFRFEDDEKKTDKLSLTIDNSEDLSAIDGDLWETENEVRFQFGFPGLMSPVYEGTIAKISGFNPLAIEVDAKDALMNRIQRTDRVDENVKRSDVVRKICKDHGYTDDKLFIDDTRIILEQVTQGGMTDYQFLKSLAAREGYEFYVDFDGAHFHPRDTKQSPIRTYKYFVDRTRSDIISISLEKNKRAAAGNPGAVTLAGKDATTGEPFTVRGDADSTATDRTTLADATESHGTEAKEIEAVDEFGNTFLTTKPAAQTGASEVTGATTEKDEASAQRVANGAYLKQQLRAVTLDIVVMLDPLVRAKSVVRIEGVGQKLSGNWYVKNALHDLEHMTTRLKLGREGMNGQGVPLNANQNDKDGPDANDPNGPAQQTGPVDVVDDFGSVTTVERPTGGRGQ
jgi:phage protein D